MGYAPPRDRHTRRRMDAEYIVVGAGSAGCVLAARLSQDGARVVLLEAGPKDRNPFIHIPAGVSRVFQRPELNWGYHTEPEDASGQRSIFWPRGRVIGGSGSINGMLYVRGNRADYDGWAQMGCRGWSYDDVLPFFKQAERYCGQGDDTIRGRDGPLEVQDYNTILPLTHFFVQAAQQAGFAFNPDLNGASQEGVGYSQMTRLGRLRGSTARTYLKPARRHSNLRVETDAQATRLIMDGRRCIGITYRQGAEERTVHVTREVIVAGGAINSPQLLQVSGIGPASHLASLGIEVAHDLPGVGENLHDHYVVRVSHRIRNHVSINQLSRGPRVAAEVVKWALFGTGALTFGITSAQVFCRSREGLESPDIQLLFTPSSYDGARFGSLEREPGVTIVVCPARPRSRGQVMATAADPFAKPLIQPNYLGDPDDLRVMRAGLTHARRVFAAPALADHSAGELTPGREVIGDAALDAFTRANGTTLYHPVGTCRMGEDSMAVVDSRLRVRGLDGLRIADASIMPVISTGNTNAPTIMIAEKAATMIREDAS